MARSTRADRIAMHLWAQVNAFDNTAIEPEDWPVSFRADPVGLWPLLAGDGASGLIGLYTVVNAIDLVLAPSKPLAPSEIDWLLDLGWRFLIDRQSVQLSSSVRMPTMVRLADALSFSISRRRGRFVMSSGDIVTVDGGLTRRLERHVVARHAVIVLLGGGHYTVLRGFTRDSWLLFDCAGRKWIKRGGRRGGPWRANIAGPRLTQIIVLSTG